MAKKYAGLDSLQTFLANLRTIFAPITHSHKLSDISDYVVDSELSPTSTNPVQNTVLNAEFDAIGDAMGALELAIDGKANSAHTHAIADVDGLSTIIETYILNINYETLAFDTSELVVGDASSPILGVGMLGYMVLG